MLKQLCYLACIFTLHVLPIWASCLISHCSTIGYCTFLGNNCISQCAKKQPTIAHLSVEVEYRAMAYAIPELTWLTYLLCDLDDLLPEPHTLLCNNINDLRLTINPIFYARTNHI